MSILALYFGRFRGTLRRDRGAVFGGFLFFLTLLYSVFHRLPDGLDDLSITKNAVHV